MITINTVNAAIKKLGGTEKLFKGDGYFYFWGDDTPLWESTSVYVYRINDLSLESWVAEYKALKKLGDERVSAYKLFQSDRIEK